MRKASKLVVIIGMIRLGIVSIKYIMVLFSFFEIILFQIKNTPLILLFSSLFTLLFTFLRNFDIASIILVTSLIKVTVFNLFLT